MTVNLEKLTLPELKSLQSDVAKAIASFEERRKGEARAALEAAAKSYGFTLAELTSLPATKRRAAVAPKYAHPENPSVTWSGRGRKPKWVEAALAGGKGMADLAI